MQYLNKKGMSSIIQVTILAALSILSLSLIWTYVMGLSNGLSGQLSPTVDCITQKSEITNACITDEGEIETRLNVALGEKITKVDLKVNGESFVCGTNSCQSCTFTEAENKKTIYIQPAQTVSVYDKMIFNINGCASEEITLTNCP